MAAMRVIGLTGGIGSGKSTVAQLLRARGVRVIDADQLAREAVEPGAPALDEIRQRFGDGVMKDGQLDRPALAAIVFSDSSARRDLEAITHPRIGALLAEQLGEAREAGVAIVVYEAPLIVEKKLYEGFDALIVVSAGVDTAMKRVIARDGMTAGEARARIDAQLPLEEKVRVADYVVDNDGSRDATAHQVDEIWRRLTYDDPEEEEEEEEDAG